jgi:cyclin-dependent kinase inhibitor 3 (CDKN3)
MIRYRSTLCPQRRGSESTCCSIRFIISSFRRTDRQGPRMSRLHWIELQAAGRLAIMARPRADDWLEAEVAEWRACGLAMVVSLLDRDEASELGLQPEFELCRANGIEFVSFPISDRGVPEIRPASELASSIAGGILAGRSIAIHCRAGIGRSSLIAAAALICLGVEAGDALVRIKEARGVSVPDTDEQRDWILNFGKAHPGP